MSSPPRNPNLRSQPLDSGFDNPGISGQPALHIGTLALDATACALLARHCGLAGDAGDLGDGNPAALQPRSLHLFAARVPDPLPGHPDAWRLELAIAEQPAAQDAPSRWHHLAQRGDVPYEAAGQASEQGQGTFAADMLKPEKQTLHCLQRPPRWKLSEAHIPLRSGKLQRQGNSWVWQNLRLYAFAGQWPVPPTEAVRRQGLAGGFVIYLFAWLSAAGGLLLKATTQDVGAQSAEDHYRLEHMLVQFEQAPHDMALAATLVAKGGADLHQALLAHPRCTAALLHRHAKTKALKTQIEKRLARLEGPQP